MVPPPHNAPPGFDWIVRLHGWRLRDGVLTLDAATNAGGRMTVIFEAVAPSVWRFTALPPGNTPPSPTPMLLRRSSPSLPLRVDDDGRGITVSGSRLSLRIEREPWRVAFRDGTGTDICRENPGDIDGLGRSFVLPLGFVRNEVGNVCVTESFHLRPDEHLFGLGEKFTPLEKTAQRIVGWTQDAFGSTSERSHKNVPFLWSTRGYGIMVDSGARITWELGTVSCQTYTVIAESPSWDAYILYGPSPADILQQFADLTGHAPVPPKWTFGLWVSSGGTYRDRGAIERLVDGLEQHDIPADVVHVDPWWMRWRHYCDFQWDEAAFPRPEEFIKRLHGRMLKLCLWEHPYVSVESDLFSHGAEKGYFLLRPDGTPYVIDYGLSLAPRPDGVVRTATREYSWNARVAIIDLTNPDAVAWFKDLHRPSLRMGVDVFKTDFGEDIPQDALFHNGQTGASMHNLYPLLYNEAVFEVTREESGSGIVWSRSGTAGNQRYPVCWSGDPAADFESLACTIRGGLSAGMSGIPFWSNDIGGYRGTPAEDLYVRWAQFGLLCSHSRMHGDGPREPWAFGERALGIVRQFVRLRYQLFPYLYSTAYESAATGLPVIRALPLAFPDDLNAYGRDLEFLLGPWLLVAPVVTEDGRRNVYIPPGIWFDFWNGTRLRGPENLQVESPLATIPLYVRGGAVVPMMSPALRIPSGPVDPLILDVYPYGESLYRLHEDEGITNIRCTALDVRTTLEWTGGPGRGLTVRFNGIPPSASALITVDGVPLNREAARQEHDGRTLSVQVPFSRGGSVRIDH